MKKITILFALLSFCIFSFAQYASQTMELSRSADYVTVVKSDYQKPTYDAKDAFWYNDFSDPTDWIIESAPGTDGSEWIITTYEEMPAGWTPVFGMPETFASTTVDNGFALFNSDIQGADGGDPQDAWIQYANPIDFSTMAGTPRLTFETYYARWQCTVTFEWSTDDGATWDAVELLTEIESHSSNASPPDYVATVNLPQLIGLDNVHIRFRQQGDWDYGWFIDDIMFVDAPDYEIIMSDARMNFIDYIDYTAEGQESYYHYSSHYGMIPVDQYDSPHMLSWFNVVVENTGLETVTPLVNIIITDPSENVVFDETMTGTTIAGGARDTVDFIETAFALGANPEKGLYNVHYSVTIQGQEIDLTENTRSATFVVTDYTMSRDANNITHVTGPGMWLSGGNDGDMIASNFLFLYEEEIYSMDVFIAGSSTPGTAFMGRIMTFDSGSSSWVDLTTSTLITIEEEHLGTWVNVEFIDPVFITFEGDDEARSIKAAIEFYYGGEDNTLWIGYDRDNPHSFWSAVWYFTEGANANQWFSITNWTSPGGLGIRLNTGEEEEEENFVAGIDAHDISIYPNPTTGFLNIDNVQGANIEIMNLMGQTVQTVANANEFNTVDMSSYANGTYIVRIIKDGNVITQKVNLID